MNKTLILRRDIDDGLTRSGNNYSASVYYRVDYNNILLRILRKVRFSYFIGPFLGNWRKNLKQYHAIIMFDNGYHKVIARYIKRNNPNCKLILWFWNPIFSENKKYLGDKEVDEVWSYDKDDCRRYSLRYNTQFFNRKNIVSGNIIDYDIVFVGAEKGRKGKLDEAVSLIKKNGLSTKIIVPQNKSDYLSYEKYMELVSKSNSILEIMGANATGLTLRSLESIFCEKKLITDNSNIVDYDFYRPENIFIIGKDDPGRLKDFISSPYKKINQKIVDYYEFENWIKRFEGKEQK